MKRLPEHDFICTSQDFLPIAGLCLAYHHNQEEGLIRPTRTNVLAITAFTLYHVATINYVGQSLLEALSR